MALKEHKYDRPDYVTSVVIGITDDLALTAAKMVV